LALTKETAMDPSALSADEILAAITHAKTEKANTEKKP